MIDLFPPLDYTPQTIPEEEAPHLPESWIKAAHVALGCLAFLVSVTTIGANRRRRAITHQNGGAAPTGVAAPTPSPQPIEVNDPDRPPDPYDQLRCTTDDQDLVYRVISPLGRDSALTLWSRENELEAMGNDLRARIHPYKFLQTIFQHPELRATVQAIFASNGLVAREKQKGFLRGVTWGMRTYGRQNRTLCYVDDFVRALYAPNDQVAAANEIHQFIQRQDWNGMVRHLCLRSGPLVGERSQG